MNQFQELTDFLDKYSVTYTVKSDCVEVEGFLSLSYNSLTYLPESFGNLKIGGYLDLSHNSLKYLPESFGNLKIGGGLWLDSNSLTSLPESFGNLEIIGNLYLSGNSLKSLPESFGNLKIYGGLFLDSNSLISLPESFGNLKIGCGLYLSNNSFAYLPESFGNLKIGGGLWLDRNSLLSLPESFGNLKIGGDLYFSGNSLASIPEIPNMTQTIEKDWCYIDGIVREIESKKTINDLTVIKTPFDYMVGKNSTWAHGRTIQEATQDYNFKLINEANLDLIKELDLDEPMSHEEAINVYRTVTRACRDGIRQWMSDKTFPEQITIREIISLTKSAYGGDDFARFFHLSQSEGIM
jgi:hypothetical protein